MATNSYLVLDVETSKSPRCSPWDIGSFLSSLCIETPDGTSRVWFFNPATRDHAEMIAEIQELINSSSLLVGHNIKFDLNWLKWAGLKCGEHSVFDTMVAEYLLNGQSSTTGYSLNATTSRHDLGSKVDQMSEFWDAGYETDEIPLDIHEEYLRQDVSLTHKLFLKQIDLLDKAGLVTIAELCFRVTQILSDTEVNGFLFDKDEAIVYCDKERVTSKSMTDDLIRLAGREFSPASPTQLAVILYGGVLKREVKELRAKLLKSGKYKITTRKSECLDMYPGLGFKADALTKAGNPSTSDDTVAFLKSRDKRATEFITKLRNQRKLLKVISSIAGSEGDAGLVTKIGKDGRIHPSFNQCVTRTGRLSSQQPNAQNLPRGNTSPIKKFVKPLKDYIVNIDLSQIEWRIAADLSGDKTMIDELWHGLDIHTDNATKFFGAGKYEKTSDEFKSLRTTAKVLGFRLLYGGSATGFFKDPSMPSYSKKKWTEIVDAFYGKYSGLKSWQESNVVKATAQGYIRNPSGRVLTFDKSIGFDGTEETNGRQVSNYPVQSASSDVMYLFMDRMYSRIKELGLDADLRLQVHDSMVFDVSRKDVRVLCKEAIKIMNTLPSACKEYFGWDIKVPLMGECEVGKTYGDTRKVKEELLDDEAAFNDFLKSVG